MWELIPFYGALSRRRLIPIKPVYGPDQPDGRLSLTASSFNQVRQYISSPGRRGPLLLRITRRFLPHWWPYPSPVLIAPIHAGMARLSWPGWLVTQQDGLPARRLSPIPVWTRFNIEQLCWSRPTRCHYDKLPPSTEDVNNKIMVSAKIFVLHCCKQV